MPNPRQDVYEEWAIALLQKVIDLDREQRDALPGSVVKCCKDAQRIMKKRRKSG